MLDPEIKALMGEVKSYLAEQKTIKGAVAQLEEQMRGVPQTIENKLSAVRRMSFDDRGRYRGVFGNEGEARSFGLCVLGTVGGDQRALGALKAEFKDVFERAMGSSPDSAGGVLVPVEYSTRIQRLVEEFGCWGSSAFPMPMSSDSLTFQRRVSGVSVFKTGQNVAATGSEPKYATINLNADEWNTLTLYPKSLGEDSATELGELIAIEIAQAFAQAIDDCGFVGDGTPDYLDVLGINTRLITINGVDDGGGLVLGAGNLWSELVEGDFLKVMGRTPRFAAKAGKWFCSNEFFWTVMAKLTFAKGGVTAGEFNGVRSLMFLGKPVEITQSMPRTEANSQVACLFGDLRMSSTYGRRKELTIDRSTEVKFIERQVAVLGTQRHAINNHSLGDATNAGPVVGLITAAA